SMKEELTDQENITHSIELNGKKVEFSLSRQEFESLIANLVKRTITLAKNIVDDLEIDIDQIEGIILVGGSTRVPLIKAQLAQNFKGTKIFDEHNPDFIVAYGAALQANN